MSKIMKSGTLFNTDKRERFTKLQPNYGDKVPETQKRKKKL